MLIKIVIPYLYIVFVLLTGLTCSSDSGKDSRLEIVMELPVALKECSGMASLGDGLYVGQNDSGNKAELYVFQMDGGAKVRSIEVDKAKNVDWEELAEDETYIYIGDFGNNNGNRKNLGVYKVRKDELLESDEVKAEQIEFSFPDQSDFSNSANTNFDCEAMVCIGDSLYLFTKNHGNQKTNLYSLSKTPGKYSAKWLGVFNAKGLITGADYRIVNQIPELVLVGYTDRDHGHRPFLIYFKKLHEKDFFQSSSKRMQLGGQLQIESILFEDHQNVLVSSEGKNKKDRNVYRVKIRS